MKLPMKLLRIVGLCLTAIFAVSMFASASAFATWEDCTTEKAAEAKSRYTTNQCTTASSTGGWNWQEVKGTDAVRIKGSLLLADTKVPIAGNVQAECYGEAEGVVGPGQLGKTTKVTVLSCRAVKGCESAVEPKAEARNLPWQTEAYNTEGKKLTVLKGDGNGEPSWKVTCRVLGIEKADICVAEGPETLELKNELTAGVLLVKDTFLKKRKAKCEVGGAGAGEVTNSVATLLASGGALRIT